MIFNTLRNGFNRFLLIAIGFLFTTCSGKSTNVTIEGEIVGADNKLVLLRETSHNRIQTIDSTRTDEHGYFFLNPEVSNPSFVLLQVEGEYEPIILLVEPKEKITIKGSAGTLSSSYTVAGSRGSAIVRDLNLRFYNTVKTIDSLSQHFRNSREQVRFDSIKVAIDKAYDKAINNHKEYTKDFIKENRYSLAAILALYQQYDETRPVLNSRDDFELFQLVDSVLYPLYPYNPLVANLHRNVKKITSQLKLYDKKEDMLNEGEVIPNLSLPLVNGDTTSLHDAGAKYTIIDFWATWCNNCLRNNNHLKQLYKDFSLKGFEVIQISLDENHLELKRAIEDQELPWLIVVDYQQWESPLLDSLSINSIPSNYLIDNNGIVVGRNLSHKELRDMLTRLLP